MEAAGKLLLSGELFRAVHAFQHDSVPLLPLLQPSSCHRRPFTADGKQSRREGAAGCLGSCFEHRLHFRHDSLLQPSS